MLGVCWGIGRGFLADGSGNIVVMLSETVGRTEIGRALRWT